MCVTKANVATLWPIVPAAGVGSRFSPISRWIAKEMLPVGNLPAIDFVLQELLAQPQLQQLTLVVNKRKTLLVDYVQQMVGSRQTRLVMQHQPLGLGHAVLQALPCALLQDALLLVLLPDNIFVESSMLQLLLKAVDQIDNCCAAVVLVSAEDDRLSQYGVAALQQQIQQNLFVLSHIVEKPTSTQPPSNLVVMGRYLLSSCIVPYLADLPAGANGEIQLTDAINALIVAGKTVLGVKFDGQYFDVGYPSGWLQANNFFLQDREQRICKIEKQVGQLNFSS